MEQLSLPEIFKGRWHHSLIMTYGADLQFYEGAIWREMPPSCTNRIILADGEQFLSACDRYASNAVVRFLNRRYVAEGIFGHPAAHAKVILLTNDEAGRLAVGSGNLGPEGYSTGGELFTVYEYNGEILGNLPAFHSVRRMIEHLVEAGQVRGRVLRHIDHLFEGTPWLFAREMNSTSPVRDNLQQSFLEQLASEIGDKQVEELWVLSPFYDPECAALHQLISRFDPHRSVVLIQDGFTRVDPKALEAVRDAQPEGSVEVRSFHHATRKTLVHAKLCLLKLEDEAICLQGSPNLSRVAMLRSGNMANVEVANMLRGERDEFDYLLELLGVRDPVDDLDQLGVEYDTDDDAEISTPGSWRLLSAEWDDPTMTFYCRGELPASESNQISVFIDGIESGGNRVRRRGATVDVTINEGDHHRLRGDVPVQLQITDQTSNPVFPAYVHELDALLQRSTSDEDLQQLADLSFDDDRNLEELFHELQHSVLVVDANSIRALSGNGGSSRSGSLPDEESGTHLRYEDIDYDEIRRHPRIRQYIDGFRGGSNSRSQLQLLLSSITSHYQEFIEWRRSPGAMPENSNEEELNDGEPVEDEETAEQDAQDQERRRVTLFQRRSRILKNFFNRFQKGLESPDLHRIAGSEVIVQNYAIYEHILWKLLGKDDWIDHQSVLKALSELWNFFWGSIDQPGYYWKLPESDREQARALLQMQHAHVRLFAALYFAARETRLHGNDHERAAVRDILRGIFTRHPYEVSPGPIEGSSRLLIELIPLNTPDPQEIARTLEQSIWFDTRRGFLRSLESTYEFSPRSCRFEDAMVMRPSIRGEQLVAELVISDESALTSAEQAQQLLGDWMRYEDREYYRVSQGVRRVAYFDLETYEGVYWARDLGEQHELTEIPEGSETPWSSGLEELWNASRDALPLRDEKLSIAG